MSALLAETNDVKAWLDGRLSSLLESMDSAGIDRAVLCSIATRPEQFEKILAWSQSIDSARIVPFPSVHPDDPNAVRHVGEIARSGFRGIKLHPYYQAFKIDDERMFPIYEAITAHGLSLVCHTGFDIAFPRVRIADPKRIAAVADRFPDLIFVATHLGGWYDWDEVEAHLCGRRLYMEISFSLEELPPDRAGAIILQHPREYVLFGTDSPWTDQIAALTRFRSLDLGPEWEKAILEDNAERLLQQSPAPANN